MTLSDYITRHNLDPVKTMNLLQDHGIVSDNCVEPADVGNPEAAIRFLQRNLTPTKQAALNL